MMRTLLRRALARLRVAPFGGRWTPRLLENANELESALAATDRTR